MKAEERRRERQARLKDNLAAHCRHIQKEAMRHAQRGTGPLAKKGSSSLMDLRVAYRAQHQAMTSARQGDNVMTTTRRRRHFIPRGTVYINLLMQEIKHK